MNNIKSNKVNYLIIACMLASLMIFSGCTTKEDLKNEDNILILDEPKANLLTFSNQVVDGDYVTIDVLANGMSGMSGLQIGVVYDPEYLTYDSASEGDFLKQNGATTLFFDLKKFPKDGLVKDVVIARQGGDVTGNGLVAKLRFKVLKKGTSTVDFEEVIVANKDGNKVPVTTKGLSVIVN